MGGLIDGQSREGVSASTLSCLLYEYIEVDDDTYRGCSVLYTPVELELGSTAESALVALLYPASRSI